MVNKDLYIAFLLSLAAHGAVLGIGMPALTDMGGDDGVALDIVVLGMIDLSRLSAAAPEAYVAGEKQERMVELADKPSDIALRLDRDKGRALLAQSSSLPSRSRADGIYSDGIFSDTPEDDPGSTQMMDGCSGDIKARYLRDVMRKLEAAKRYPAMARRRGVEGTVEVAFVIMADGGVGEILRRRSSGQLMLDKAAVAMVERAAPFAPIPDELNLGDMMVDVPVLFRIE